MHSEDSQHGLGGAGYGDWSSTDGMIYTISLAECRSSQRSSVNKIVQHQKQHPTDRSGLKRCRCRLSQISTFAKDPIPVGCSCRGMQSFSLRRRKTVSFECLRRQGTDCGEWVCSHTKRLCHCLYICIRCTVFGAPCQACSSMCT